MILYLIPLFVSVFGIFIFDLNKNKGSQIVYCSLFVYLVLLIGLRFEVGGDTLVYMEDYKWRSNLSEWKFSWMDYYEPLYTLLCAFSKSIGENFVYFQILHAVILNSCLFYFISKNTEYRFSAIFFCFIYYYLYFSTEILRESLAIFIFVLNYKNLEKGNWLKYYSGVCVAVLFHISAIVLILFPLVRKMKFNLIYFVVLLLSVFLFINIDVIFSVFMNFSKISDKMSSYNDVLLVDGGVLGVILTFLIVCRFSLLPLLIYLWDKKVLKESPRYEGLVCFYTLLGIGAFFNTTIFERLPNYITPLYFISLTNILVPCLFRKATLSRKLVGAIVFCLIIIVYTSFPARIYMRYIPYYSVFNPNSVDRNRF